MSTMTDPVQLVKVIQLNIHDHLRRCLQACQQRCSFQGETTRFALHSCRTPAEPALHLYLSV